MIVNIPVGTIVFSCFQHEVVVSEGDSSRILGIQGLLHVHLSELALIFVRIQQRLDKGSPDIG